MRRFPSLPVCISVMNDARHMIANLTMGHAYECEKVEAAQTMIGKLTIVAARLKDAQQERLRVCDNPKCPFNEGMWGQ